MSEISEKAIKLIKDLRRDISIDIMFAPEKNAEEDSLKALVDYIAELEAEVTKCHELQDSYCDRIAELESLVEKLIWVGNDLLDSNTNPVTIMLFNWLVCNAKERAK